MEKKFLQVNSILFTILLMLIGWAMAVIFTLPNNITPLFAVFFALISLVYIVHFVVSYLVVIKKKYNLLLLFKKGNEYFYDILDSNMHYCTNILGSVAIICNIMLLIIYTILSKLGIVDNLFIALLVVFVICLVSGLIPIIYKHIQMTIYIKEANRASDHKFNRI